MTATAGRRVDLDALDDHDRILRAIEAVRERYRTAVEHATAPGTGSLRRADLYRQAAVHMRAEAGLWREIVADRSATGQLLNRAVVHAAGWCEDVARELDRSEDTAQLLADQETAGAVEAFADDGFVWVPGRGRIRRERVTG